MLACSASNVPQPHPRLREWHARNTIASACAWRLCRGVAASGSGHATAAAGSINTCAPLLALCPFRLLDCTRANLRQRMLDGCVVGGGAAGSGLTTLFAKEVDDSLTWDFIPWLRSITRLPIYLKVRPHLLLPNTRAGRPCSCCWPAPAAGW
jgi:hypothetical protein